MKDARRNKPGRREKPETPADEAATNDASLNWQIISLLQEDGRMPFSVIAEKVGVSEGTVRNRVAQLRDQNVMEIAANVLPHAFGYTWNTNIFVKLNASADLEKVARRLAAVPEVYYVVQMTGRYDMCISSYHRDREHFRTFLSDHFYGQPDILSVDANVNLKVYKMQLKWQAEPT